MKKCPNCKSYYKNRIRRKLLAKLIPKSRAYQCDKCYTKYTWLPVINVSVRA